MWFYVKETASAVVFVIDSNTKIIGWLYHIITLCKYCSHKVGDIPLLKCVALTITMDRVDEHF